VLTVPQAFKGIDWNTGVLVGAHAALLSSVATPVNLMVVGPGGYKFGDYWKYGLPIGIRWRSSTPSSRRFAGAFNQGYGYEHG
jgi:di/tricarboxylate transporter